MENQNKGEYAENELSLKDVILAIIKWYRFVLSKWTIVLIFCVVCGLLGLAYSMYKKPLYKAELSFALEDAKTGGGLGAYSGIASQFGLDVGGGSGGAFSGDNLIVLMKSRAMIQKALLSTVNINGKSETLAEFYIDFNKLRDSWAKKQNLAHIEFLPGSDSSKLSLTQDSILGVFYKNLMANSLMVDKVDKKLSIIAVTVKSENELFSKYFTEILADKVSQFYIETKTKNASKNVSILQHQTDSVRRELNGNIYNVAASIDVNPNPNPTRQVLRAPTQHHQVDVQVNTAILAELVKNLEVAKVSLRNETPLIQVIDKPILPLDTEKVGKLKGLLVGLISGFFLSIFIIAVNKGYKSMMS